MPTKSDGVLSHLLDEATSRYDREDENGLHQLRIYQARLHHLDASFKYNLLRQLLCIRPPTPPLPENILQDVDALLQIQGSRRILTRSESLSPISVVGAQNGPRGVKVSLWKGDITTLSGVTAITNAANGQMLGCFQPNHRCIDNVIHSCAGPRLRSECLEVMVKTRDGEEVQPGGSIVTKGYLLPSPFVIHTVGPQLRRGRKPTEEQRSQLQSCYRSVLDESENLPANEDGRKAIVFCCISTGLFAFPADEAARIAIRTVYEWVEQHMGTTITDVIFNVFTDTDDTIYKNAFAEISGIPEVLKDAVLPSVHSENLQVARQWLHSADAVVVSAAAGISASDGLDYTSTALFSKHFQGFTRYGLRRLYDVFGFTSWPSEEVRWGYYFTHLNLVQNWPKSAMYSSLISWLAKFGDNAHVRTSNADGLFLANGLPEERLSTPQGAYSTLQCWDNCRPEATVASLPLVEEAQSFLDPVSQTLTDSSKIPKCRFCGGKMFLCVRAGSWFNDTPFESGEIRWKDFKRNVMNDSSKNVVILELGVGMNTPGVLRWPNDDWVERCGGRVKLIRIGMGSDLSLDEHLQESGFAVAVDGDIKLALSYLIE